MDPCMSLIRVYKVSFIIAAADLTLAVMCAILGDVHFVGFMVLAGLMWAYGTYCKHKSEQIGE